MLCTDLSHCAKPHVTRAFRAGANRAAEHRPLHRAKPNKSRCARHGNIRMRPKRVFLGRSGSENLSRSARNPLMSAGLGAALYYLFAKNDEALADAFFDAIISGATVSRCRGTCERPVSAVLALRVVLRTAAPCCCARSCVTVS
jgi:hypothetical protein